MLDIVGDLLGTSTKTRSMSEFDLSVADVQQLQAIKSELKLCRHADRDVVFLEHALSGVPLVMRLPPVLRRVLVDAFEKIDVEQGMQVVRAGRLADSFYIIGSGEFNLDSPEVNEGRSSLGRFGRGGLIGERVLYLSLVGRTPFTITCALY